MANWSYYRPGISDRAPLNLTNADGSKIAPQVSLQSPFTAQFNPASPYVRLSPQDALLKIQHNRCQYTVSAADLASPWVSGQFRIDWEDEIPTAYTVICTVEDPNFSPPYSVVNVGPIQKSKTGITGRLTVPQGMGQVGHVLTIHAISIAD